MKKTITAILLIAISLIGCGSKEVARINDVEQSSAEKESIVDQTKQDIDDLIAKADSLIEQGDIDSAITLISDAIKDYPDYSAVLSQKKESYEAAKEKIEISRITEELDTYIAENDFDTLLSVLAEYKEDYPNLAKELNEKEAEYIEQIKKIFDDWIVEADNYMVNLDHEGARNKMIEIFNIVNKEGVPAALKEYAQITLDRSQYYNTYKFYYTPLNLMSEYQVFDGNALFTTDGATYNDNCYDRYGHFYSTFFSLHARDDQTSNIMFNSNGNYDRFGASFVIPKTVDADKCFVVEVYGDNNLLSSYHGITSYDEPMTIEVDITDYKLIDFRVYREDTARYWIVPHLILFDANLYNAAPIEFECYITPDSEVQ